MSPVLQLLGTASRLVSRDDWDDWDDEDGPKNCEYATPGVNGNVPVTACNSYYNYDPQFAPAVAVAVIFFILTGIHIFEAVVFKKRYAWVLIMGGVWETLAFVFHALGAKDQQQLAYATVWNVLFLPAPLWINAFVYMTFARMVLYWHPEQKVAGLRAATIARWFVVGDILVFAAQIAGACMANPTGSPKMVDIGLKIYLVGMGIQELFIVIFVGLMVAFQRRCTGAGYDVRKSWKPLLFALYGVLVFITVRIIFRFAEFARGVGPENPLPYNEVYQYALDCFPMMLALVVLAVFHPGRYLIGPESEFPRLSRKEKKAEKRAKKAARKERKSGRDAEAEVPMYVRRSDDSGSSV